MAQINMDVDGVVYDLIPYLWHSLEKVGLGPEPVTDPKWRTWDVLQRLNEEQQRAAFSMMGEAAWWLNGPVIPYAQEAVAALRAAGHHIQWVTTAWEDCYGWRDARRDWLHRHFDSPEQDIRKDLTVTGAKDKIWADVFIDDKPSAIIAWHEHHDLPEHRGILYKTHFNHAHHEELDHIEWNPETVAGILDWLEAKYPEHS